MACAMTPTRWRATGYHPLSPGRLGVGATPRWLRRTRIVLGGQSGHAQWQPRGEHALMSAKQTHCRELGTCTAHRIRFGRKLWAHSHSVEPGKNVAPWRLLGGLLFLSGGLWVPRGSSSGLLAPLQEHSPTATSN
eukprot:CAMPEP_0174367864 /NCGR_PEP_ID=MMETSP0811_2-20130205/86942_1 /TAXON_ID=73025 ORGANISM="Eutreptiella gymnastica-like, Strain CCMP1594" /NCGR_SAMPLE_ID=MMETSP0811_2 /ASSEMBLY_ACC=CAM_ASM_000667 /LENGTH=134 /DNA_ID=CAMNT_0015510831 /DNA_START=114 /DNA_END=515 /DNA_ORIENTATION=-